MGERFASFGIPVTYASILSGWRHVSLRVRSKSSQMLRKILLVRCR